MERAVSDPELYRRRLARIEQAISDQRTFLHRVPDPDTRERAETHLYRLIAMREHLVRRRAAS